MNFTKETVESLYFEEQLSIRKIASRLGVSPSTIMKALEDSPLRSKSEAAVSRYEPLSLAGSLEELAYLVGVYLGDGCLIQSSRTELLDIACDAKYHGLIERFTNLVNQVFGKAPVLQKDPSSNCVHIRLYGTGISATLGMDLGPKNRRDLHIPSWIKENEDFTRWCLRGLFETDGYIHYRRGRDKSVVVGFSNTNESLLDEIQQLLYNLGYVKFRRNRARIDCWQYDEAIRFITEVGVEKS
ncbi:MAG: helix-turn-helix domain-containing protein [Anaerolineae bacterium]|nr:helix-turn-helix domain-containing protein [Anaerolineae bacterium]MCI0610491.1 helix-turn-helix domain-containing protein [Anaerolineae bacterium]